MLKEPTLALWDAIVKPLEGTGDVQPPAPRLPPLEQARYANPSCEPVQLYGVDQPKNPIEAETKMKRRNVKTPEPLTKQMRELCRRAPVLDGLALRPWLPVMVPDQTIWGREHEKPPRAHQPL